MSNWANKTKAQLATADAAELKPVGGGNATSKYYQYGVVGPKASPKAAQLTAGTVIRGKYLGTYENTRQITTKTGAKKSITTRYFNVETAEGKVAVPGAGQLNKLMESVADGAEVQITYNGMEEIKKGPSAGNSAHAFFVAASELKA